MSVFAMEESAELCANREVFRDPSKSSPLWRQVLASGGTALLTAAAGCSSGYSAILLPQLSRDNFTMDTATVSWLAAISCLPLFAGNLLSGFLMERLGRRMTQLCLAVPFVAGWCIIAFSNGIEFILLGRFITGACQGTLGPTGPVFVGEITAPKYRGILLSAMSLAIAVGVLASHILGTFLHWKFAAIVCGVFPAAAYVILIIVPESPSWLAAKGRIEECRASFHWYRGYGEDAQVELKNLIESSQKIISKPEGYLQRWKNNMSKPELRKPLQVMTTFFIITQFTGTNVICAYTVDIMRPLVGNQLSEYSVMLLVDSVRCISLAIASLLLRRLGRRPLAMFSGSLTALTLITLAIYIYLSKNNIVTNIPAITVVLILLYITISSLGMVPLPWTMVGEVFPAATRGFGSGISVMMTSVAFFLTVKTAPGLFRDIGLDGTFLLYGSCTLAGTIFLYLCLPETKGKTLLQVEEYFVNGGKR